MSSQNTSSLPPPPPNNINTDKPSKRVHDLNTTTNNSSSSAATNNFGSHAPAIRKAMKILEAQFGHPHISLLSSSSINEKMMTVNASTDFSAGSSQSQELHSQTFNVVATASVDVGNGNKNKRKKKTKTINHRRIHSLPHPKYGPYTCSECFQVVPTSQKFANHVTSHYKLDSEEEKKKRNTSETQERSDLRFDQSEVAPVNNEDHTHIAPAPRLSGLKLKVEHADN